MTTQKIVPMEEYPGFAEYVETVSIMAKPHTFNSGWKVDIQTSDEPATSYIRWTKPHLDPWLPDTKEGHPSFYHFDFQVPWSLRSAVGIKNGSLDRDVAPFIHQLAEQSANDIDSESLEPTKKYFSEIPPDFEVSVGYTIAVPRHPNVSNMAGVGVSIDVRSWSSGDKHSESPRWIDNYITKSTFQYFLEHGEAAKELEAIVDGVSISREIIREDPLLYHEQDAVLTGDAVHSFIKGHLVPHLKDVAVFRANYERELS